ncbi:MAG: aminomethyl-transferring glycine dehydrogenase subunit GcvPA [Thermoplasmatales archaeon]|nr:MAG: aminomethyl-transferring glycine dehydrogenase subunit GcvPA [Thermoplasmatales archaeon]
MKFIPNSAIKDAMLKEIKLNDIDDLFLDIPEKIKIKDLELSKGLSQQDAERKLRHISMKNKSFYDILNFMGGGIKPHYIPSVIKSISSRAEFYTAYTPYQSEASQGFLQAMFEYQSMIAELTSMDISNASLYDGFTSLGEAALMCARINRKKTFVIPQNISWEKKSVLKNYVKGYNIEIKETPYDDKTGKVDLKELEKIIDSDVTGVYLENPNFFGVFEDDVYEISKIVKDVDSLFVVGIDPLSLGIAKSPGEYHADVVIGEGRSLGNPMDFGGSSLGIFTCKKEFLRQMPGRIIGMTKDVDGNRAFCMALQTREQHIRRGRATSNICTNEGLCALAAVSYLSLLGGNGFEKISKINFEKGQKFAKIIESFSGFNKRFNGVHFNEFVIKCPKDVNVINKKLLKNNIQGGLILDNWYHGLENCMLLGISEIHSDADIERFASVIKEVF